MKQTTFEQRHQPQWQTLQEWLEALDKHQPLEATQLTDFPKLYRQVCAHLALARNRHYTPYLVERLNLLVLRGHQYFYQPQSQWKRQLVNFIRFEFPAWVRKESMTVLFATFLFMGPLLAMFIGIQINPELIYSVMEKEQVRNLESMYHPLAEHLGRERQAESDFFMFGFYIRNNITIAFQTFAGGVLFGLGTLFFLIFNGLFIGAVAGHLTHLGYTQQFYTFVIGHSALELTAIVFAGAAGLKLGIALLAPGRFTRLQSLQNAATNSIYLVYGVIGMLLLAAFIEAFWSSKTTMAPLVKYVVGGGLWLLVINYFLRVGHHDAN